MHIISYWNKRARKWSKISKGTGLAAKDEFTRVPVFVPYGQKMAMVIVTDKYGKKQTKHMLVDAP